MWMCHCTDYVSDICCLTVGYGMIRVQLASVDAYYPTYHIMFRQVSEKNTKALQVHNDIEEIGLRMDLGQIIDDDATIIMTAMDNNGIRLNKAELEEGTFPKMKRYCCFQGSFRGTGNSGNW